MAVIAGIIIFPACFTYDVEVTAGPGLLFDTMATVFNNMAGGRWWGTLFFLFMVFAAMSTVPGVCENILAMVRELTGWSRPVGCIVCGVGTFLLALTTALGFSVIHFQPFAAGTTWLDFWDFLVSNNIMPIGSILPGSIFAVIRSVGPGQIPGGSQRGKRIESAALDEAGVQVFCSGGGVVHLCVRNSEFCVEIK